MQTQTMGNPGRLHIEVHPRVDEEKRRSAIFFLVSVVVLQVLVLRLRAWYPKRFQEVTLVGLWLYPFIVLFKGQDLEAMVFIAMWVAWSAQTFRLLKLSLERSLEAKTPERVYSWFLRTHTVCYVAGMASLYLMLFLPRLCLTVLFFSLYFAVLGRDFAEIAANRISSTIGFHKYENPPPNLCALCGDELRPLLDLMGKSDEEKEAAEKSVFKLPCGHEFHEQCLRGWTIVGKKDTCALCREKVNLHELIPDLPWNSRRVSVLWIRLLGILRFLVVWNPIIINLDLLMMRLFHFAPLTKTKEHID